MALTVTVLAGASDFATAYQGHHKAVKIVVADIAFDSSYPTGGEALATTDIHADCSSIDAATFEETAAYFFVWDDANDKIVAYVQGDTTDNLAEVADTTDLSAVNIRAVLFCQ
jgi:hypothetical protein